MTDSRLFPCLTAQMALACNLCTTYYLLTVAEAPPSRFFPGVLLVYAPLIYLINRLFLHRERTMRALVLLNLCLGGSLLGAYLFTQTWPSFAYPAITAAFLIWTTFRGYQAALNGSALRGVLLTLDMSVVLLVFFAGYSAWMPLNSGWGLCAAGGFCLSVLSAASCRSSRTPGPRTWLAVGVGFGLLLVVMLVFLGVAAAPTGQLLVTLWTALTSAAGAVGRFLFAILEALLSLFPPPEEDGGLGYEPIPIPEINTEPTPEPSPVVAAVLAVLFLLAALGLVIWGLRRMGRVRLKQRSMSAPVRSARRERVSLLKGLLQLLAAWAQAIRLRAALWRNRNTPKGLYFLLERRCRMSPWRKRPGETPREFLLRLALAARQDPELAETLNALIPAVDAAFYAGAPAVSLPYAPLVRRRIGAAARQQFLHDLATRLKTHQKGRAAK